MDANRIAVFLHLILSIVLVGQALFWFIMLAALRRSHGDEDVARLLQEAASARWPHVVVPYRLRLPLPWLGLMVLAAVLATGAMAIVLRGSTPSNLAWTVKLVLFALLIVVQTLLVRRPSPVSINLNMAIVLAMIVASALSIRS